MSEPAAGAGLLGSPESVFCTYPIPEPGLFILRMHFDTGVFSGAQAPAPAEIVQGAAGCAGLVALVRDQVSDEVMAALPRLRAVANYGVGYDNVDLNAASRRGVLVTNTPDVLTEATADLTWALLLALARRLGEGERMVRAGKFHGWDPRMLLGADVSGATLGLVGFGRIAHAVARRAQGFAMSVIYSSRREDRQAESMGMVRVPLERVLQEADFVSIHVALTPETRHLIDAGALRRMRPTAYLINTSRGPVVDEVALLQALREGWIAGAALDVYEREPDVPVALRRLENVVLLPHLGSATRNARAGMARLCALNMVAALSGQVPPNLVNRDVLGIGVRD